jgi:anti-anti-sigma factor
MTLSIVTSANDGYHVITLEGDVDTKTAPALLQALTEIELSGITDLRIEMFAVGFLSSAGLRALVFAKQKMPHESKLILIGAAESIGDVIQKTGLTQAVMLVNSHDEIG